MSIGVVALLTLAFIFLKPGSIQQKYAPVIIPEDFTSSVTNPYFTLTPGTQFTYEAKKSEGVERTEATVLNETRLVMGVTTTVIKDQVFLDGELIEDTRDWYAQDQEGNVWYFGEETAEYENGGITTTEGSWEGGTSGALPGIVMKANPQIGDRYRQEYLKGIAEDMADVVSLSETITVPYGTFSGCLKTYDYTPLNPNAKEYKYYCKDVGAVVLEEDLEDNERLELIAINRGVTATPVVPTAPSVTQPPAPIIIPTPQSQPSPSPAPKEITESEARAIALDRVHGTVTDITIETKFGKRTYVVEIQPNYGSETDVIIDIYTGEILAVED